MRGAALGVAGLAVVAGVALGLSVTSTPAPAPPSSAVSSAASSPSAAAGSSTAAGPTARARTCVDPDALVAAYSAARGGDARSAVVPGSVRCAGSYATAKVTDPSLPDSLNVLFARSRLRLLRTGTGPVCEVGSGEGGLPPISAAQGAVLNCA